MLLGFYISKQAALRIYENTQTKSYVGIEIARGNEIVIHRYTEHVIH